MSNTNCDLDMNGESGLKVLFVTHLCAHYRVKTFELLASKFSIRIVFYSQGGERYWSPKLHGAMTGDFSHEYLSGFNLGSLRVTPVLIKRLLQTDADVILKCINGRFAVPTTFFLARMRKKPFVLWTGIWSNPTTLFHRITFPFTRYLYRHADTIAVYGEHVKKYLVDLDVQPDKIFLAPHALDNEVYNRPVSPEERAGLRKQYDLADRPVILFSGRLEKSKGLDYLVEAVGALGSISPVLVFVGDGSDRESLQASCAAHNVAVRFTGIIPTHELYRYYAIASVFVLPSITTEYGREETWGLVINEAMNQQIPVVASEAVGAAAGGLVRDGETGLVVPERDAGALSHAIGRLLTDQTLAKRLAKAGHAEIAQRTNERMVDGFVKAIHYAAKVRTGTGNRGKG